LPSLVPKVEEVFYFAAVTAHCACEELASTAGALLQVATDVVYLADFAATFTVRFALIKRRLRDTYAFILLSVNNYVVI